MGNSQGKPVDLDGEVNLNHFRLLRVVGRGAFGKVRIVERKDTGLTFALKYIRKDEVVRSESVRNIIRERRMLEHVNHPFICNLRYSFQDIEYMYLVVDLMSGGDLRFHISRKTFTEAAVRFWIAELGCALRYIHGQNIIHRDVKPDNVLLDADGHVHLTDFNVASDIVPGRTLTSKSGTLAYLAPEVYAGKGYDVRADWWSLGVLFYECIYNKRPFEGNSEQSLSQTIQAANPRFPVTQPPVQLSCMYAIKDALEFNPDKRLGHTWESFIYHEFFSGIDFDALERKQVEPVFVPSSEKTNFDATYDLEELLLEEAPLEARARRQKPREKLKDDATEKEIREEELYRMIETDFRPFDYTLAAYKKITEGQAETPDGQPTPVTDENARPAQALTTDEATQMTSHAPSHAHSHSQAVQTHYPNGSHSSFQHSNAPNGQVAHNPNIPERSNSMPKSSERNVPERSNSMPKNTERNVPERSNSIPKNPERSNSIQSAHSHSHAYNAYDSQRAAVGPRPTSSHRPGRSGGVPASRPPPLPPYPQSYTTPVRQGRGNGSSSLMVGSPTGGVQVTLDGGGSWSDLARQDATLPTDAAAALGGGAGGKDSGGGGIFGLFRGKKGRGSSPKPKERGVLGKEGARVVVG
ncbi:protein kinase [Neurospora intermedia]|uniref:Protein kinase n=1 Tax=Neurospora intermedia TaxID=5142 RepID=A0ABR3D9G5_NEUIN